MRVNADHVQGTLECILALNAREEDLSRKWWSEPGRKNARMLRDQCSGAARTQIAAERPSTHCCTSSKSAIDFHIIAEASRFALQRFRPILQHAAERNPNHGALASHLVVHGFCGGEWSIICTHVAGTCIERFAIRQVVSRKSVFTERSQELARAAAGHDGSFKNR